MQMHDGIERLIDSLTPGTIGRIANDASSFEEVLAVTAMAVDESEELLLDAVTAARSAGYTWTQIGDALGISRQAAQARFTATDEADRKLPAVASTAPGDSASESSEVDLQALGFRNRRLMKLPFVDVEALNQAGKFGWHAVKTTTDGQRTAAHHIIELDDQQWEHAFTRSRKRMSSSDGWERIESPRRWGISYWARPLGTPVLPGSPDPNQFALT